MAAQGSRIPQVEPTDPLYVHPSDNPAQPLVSNAFNGENYDGWKRFVSIALSARHKLSFIDGTSECPTATSPLYSLWQRNNAMVISWLLNSLHEKIRNSVLYFDTAKALWDDLEGRFGQFNKARLFQVQKDIVCLSQGDLDIVNYYTKVKQLWDEYRAVSNVPHCTCAKCECGVNGKLYTYTEEQRLIQFLIRLNSSYTVIRENILMMSPFPSMSQAYSLLAQEERQRQLKTEQHFLGENTSFSAGTSNTTFPTGPSKQLFNPKKSDGRKSTLFCEHCKRNGHTIERCYRIHGFPSKFQTRERGGFSQSSNIRAYNSWTEPTAPEG